MRIPGHVLRRNRNAAEAERNAQHYARPVSIDTCARCGKPEDEHIFGDCDDLKGVFTPRKPAEVAR